MNLVWGFLIIAGVASFAVTAMLLVRRRAPEGSYFSDGDRASGVFGVLATGFSVLLGLVVFLAFTSFDQSRVGAEEEALVLRQQVETAQFFPDAVARRADRQLICYGRCGRPRRVAAGGGGHPGSDINPWGLAMFQTVSRSSRKRRARRLPTTSGSTRPSTGRARGPTASTGLSGSSRLHSGWCWASSRA